ncbi:putative peptidase (DUF1758) domain-containing protein [Ditylenchus destructor]|uniref:Peptidase (DUF1758) domain-containing protein n=1 Tax=Ditylenchus destructor TaxID=166010 RepID=A0AAD4MK13_9BILA|nr:putative peptidase (DUF1758) domain-containing protein [Ditylenchus destructor]
MELAHTLDNSSNKSYIKESTAKELNLNAKNHEDLTRRPYTFGNTASAVRHSTLTEFGLLLPNRSRILIKANIVGHIDEPIKHKKNDVIEFSISKAQPDILIGADHFWTLFRNMKPTTLKHGITRIPSKVSPIITENAKNSVIKAKRTYSATEQKFCQSANRRIQKVTRSTEKVTETTPSQPRIQKSRPQTKQFVLTTQKNTPHLLYHVPREANITKSKAITNISACKNLRLVESQLSRQNSVAM